MVNNKHEWLQSLLKLCTDDGDFAPEGSYSKAQLKTLTEELRTAMVNFGSATPDNLAAAALLSVKVYRNGGTHRTIGLCLKNQNVSVQDLMYEVESIEMPDHIKKQYPTMTQEDWEAAFRAVVLILGVFESSIEN